MRISDLLDKTIRVGAFDYDKVLKCDLIALDAKGGKVLFDTEKNKKEYIEQYKKGKVVALWEELRKKGYSWNCYFCTVIMCYVLHDSWKEGESE